jgi:hypothetical protein
MNPPSRWGALTPLALAWASFAPRGQDSLAKLDIDTLIDRLPRIEEQWVPKQDEPGVESHPLAAEMAYRLDEGVTLSDEQWRRALLGTGTLRWRERWPVGQPFAVSMREPTWLNMAAIKLVPRYANLEPARMTPALRCAFANVQGTRMWSYQELGSLSVGRHEIPFDTTIERQMTARSRRDPRPPLWHGELTCTVDVVDTLDDAIPPQTAAAIDGEVREALSLARAGEDGSECDLLVFDPDRSPEAPFATLGFSLEIELLRAGVPKAGTTLVPFGDEAFCARSVHQGPAPTYAWGVPLHIPHEILDDPAELAEWSIRVSGGTAGILEQWDAATRWAGVLEIRLDELVHRERTVAPDGRGPWWSD